MNELTQLIVFRLEGQRYAVLLDAVERIVQAVEVTALPKAPPNVLGLIDVAGDVLPVFSLRRRLKLPEKDVCPSDQFVIASTDARKVVVIVDGVEGVVARPPIDFVSSTGIVPGLESIQGVVRLGDGLALIHDLEKFLSSDEARGLEEAMSQEANHGS